MQPTDEGMLKAQSTSQDHPGRKNQSKALWHTAKAPAMQHQGGANIPHMFQPP